MDTHTYSPGKSPGNVSLTVTMSTIEGNGTNGTTPYMYHPPPLDLGGEIRIPLYSLIFFLSVVGNALVIVTLIQNKRMRTVTNVFLLNLSIGDLLLAVFCMPFTLIPTLLRNFIFGETMCVLIRYLQGVTVGVSVFTLVAISLERYFAICQPLRSRSWQTLSHSYKSIIAVWIVAFIIMIPIATFTILQPLNNGANKCRERWGQHVILEKSYTIFLDLILLVVPLLLMMLAYGMISWTLYKGIQLEMRSAQEMRELKSGTATTNRKSSDDDDDDYDDDSPAPEANYGNGSAANGRKSPKNRYNYVQSMRHTNQEKSLAAKKRVIKMLFMVVLEFFVCWTPLYVVQTWMVFDYDSAGRHLTSVSLNFVQLLSYVSSCCNPITYCFMNKKFRQGFISAFRCCCGGRKGNILRKASDFSYGPSQRTVFTSIRSQDSERTSTMVSTFA